jgi:hypothetical protein
MIIFKIEKASISTIEGYSGFFHLPFEYKHTAK